ncbi:MAG: ferredoxin [Mycobacterium sp.]
MMRLHIDYDLCSGNGRCYAMFPELFTDDDSGYGQTVNDGKIADGQLDQAHRATLCCPEKAITIEKQ